MQESPRRSRRSRPKGRGSLPLIPVFVGVIILGFVVGAGLSVVSKRGAQPDTVALATSTPQPEPTLAPPTLAPFVRTTRPPPATASPQSAPAETETPRATQLPVVSPAPSAAATRTPAAAPTRVPPTQAPPTQLPLTSAPTPAPTPPPTATPPESPVPPTKRPSPPPTLAPAATPTATPLVAVEADSAFARLAGSVVRQYLSSIARGDNESAYAAMGEPPGSHAGALPEAGALDPNMRFERIEAHGGDSSATVNVDVMTASGRYSGEYTVRRSSTGAAIIVSHTFAKS